jgi:hypothetical protein
MEKLPPLKKLDDPARRADFLKLVEEGHTLYVAAASLGFSLGTAENTMRAEPDFYNAVEQARCKSLREAEMAMKKIAIQGKKRIVKKVISREVWMNGKRILDDNGNPVVSVQMENTEEITSAPAELLKYLELRTSSPSGDWKTIELPAIDALREVLKDDTYIDALRAVLREQGVDLFFFEDDEGRPWEKMGTGKHRGNADYRERTNSDVARDNAIENKSA